MISIFIAQMSRRIKMETHIKHYRYRSTNCIGMNPNSSQRAFYLYDVRIII